jgi:hypothetical protein
VVAVANAFSIMLLLLLLWLFVLVGKCSSSRSRGAGVFTIVTTVLADIKILLLNFKFKSERHQVSTLSQQEVFPVCNRLWGLYWPIGHISPVSDGLSVSVRSLSITVNSATGTDH